MNRACRGVVFAFGVCASVACSSDSTGSALTAGASGSRAGTGAYVAGTTSSSVAGASGHGVTSGIGGLAGSTSVPKGGAGASAPPSGAAAKGGAGAGGAGAGGATTAGTGGKAAAGAGGAAGNAGSGGAAGGGGATGNNLTGTLGALGAVKPVMAGFAITNGPETLIYLSSAPLTCAQMMMGGTKWLSSLPAGSQVIEIVVRGVASAMMYTVGPFQGEINYAEGSKSSSSEVVGTGGSITFTKAGAKSVHEGMIMGTFPMGMVSGSFHAEWCEGGTEY